MRRTAASTAGADTPLPVAQPTANELLQCIAENTSAEPTTSSTRPAKVDGIAIGILRGMGDGGRALVDIAALGLSGVWASSVVALQAHHIGQSVALAFETGDLQRPMVLGILLGGANPIATPKPPPPEAILDGERVVLTAEHEIELRCGEAALILSADGHIQLRGTYITSQASATQRILGGSVNVN
jgi:Domain of unknown function (DUF6484)